MHGLRRDKVSIGEGTVANLHSVAIGSNAKSEGEREVVLGRSATAIGKSTIVIGVAASINANASESGTNSIVIGPNSEVSNYNAIAIGYSASVEGNHGVAIGRSSISQNDHERVLGGSSGTRTRPWVVPGSFTVNGTKNFEIPHPKPDKEDTHRIRHGAVESPTAGDTLYRFTVESTKDNDMQTINLPDYFIYLNKDVQIFVTPQGHFGNGYGVLNAEEEQLEIHCQNEGEYNVLVIGTRNDNHQAVQDWDIKGIEREVGESWTGESYNFSVDEIIEVEEIKEVP